MRRWQFKLKCFYTCLKILHLTNLPLFLVWYWSGSSTLHEQLTPSIFDIRVVVSGILSSIIVKPREPINPWQITFWSIFALQNWTVIAYPVAFDVLIQAIKITKRQITNAIIQSIKKTVKYAVFILNCSVYVCSLLS